MSWQPHHVGQGGQSLPIPDDGIVASGNASGTVGKQWEALFRKAPRESKDRVLRGRNYARRGRARMLHIAPGSATAEVVVDEHYHPTLRVRPFARGEWSQLTHQLTSNLNTITSLLEGELAPELVARTHEMGAPLLPTYRELEFDCDCGDYIMPCAHVATVFHVLIDALEGDPFLLLTLRGRTREHLMATLRSRWGDDLPLESERREDEGPPPTSDWFHAPVDLPDFACSVDNRAMPAAGLRALGPPPGGSDMLSTLSPLYEAGAKAAEQAIEKVPARVVKRRRIPPRPVPVPAPAPPPKAAKKATRKATKKVAPPPVVAPVASDVDHTVDMTEVLIDHLAEYDGSTTQQIAAALRFTTDTVQREMSELVTFGIVYSEGSGAAATWWLG